jgi:hypothetical protein
MLTRTDGKGRRPGTVGAPRLVRLVILRYRTDTGISDFELPAGAAGARYPPLAKTLKRWRALLRPCTVALQHPPRLQHIVQLLLLQSLDTPIFLCRR